MDLDHMSGRTFGSTTRTAIAKREIAVRAAVSDRHAVEKRGGSVAHPT
jgi:hypothetical protein